jgi:hypothetical protein
MTSGKVSARVVRRSTAVVALSVGVAALAAVAAAAGLLTGGGSGPVPFTTVRGEVVQLYGQGLYRYDTVFAGGGQRGTDAVVLLFGVPLLLAAAWRYRRGSSRAGLLLLGTHVFILYVYGSAHWAPSPTTGSSRSTSSCSRPGCPRRPCWSRPWSGRRWPRGLQRRHGADRGCSCCSAAW